MQCQQMRRMYQKENVLWTPKHIKDTITHCLVLEKLSGWIDQRKESLWENGIPPFGSCVREEKLLNFCGSHGQKLSVQNREESEQQT
jgi:hypothetical protein